MPPSPTSYRREAASRYVQHENSIHRRTAIHPLIYLLLGALNACSDNTASDTSQQTPPPREAAPSPIAPLPYEVTLDQRSKREIPATGGDLRLTIQDITGGQVICSLDTHDGVILLPAESMKPGEIRPFLLQEVDLILRLDSLRNKLIGTDSATFSIETATTTPAAFTEEEKIEALLTAVSELKDATFVRNGSEYTAGEAADHLRRKWSGQKDKIVTATLFLDHIASKSSISGKEYLIRFADGQEVASRAFLEERLRSLVAR